MRKFLMPGRIVKVLTVVSFLAVLIVSQPMARSETITMTLTGVGSTSYPADPFAGVYVDPYVATIGSKAGVAVICDDFKDDTYQNESWTANVVHYNGTAGSLASTRMAAVTGLSGSALVHDYILAAWLSQQLLLQTDALQRAYISFALWSIFYPTGTSANPGVWAWLQSHGYPDGSSVDQAIDGWVANAAANATEADLYRITIYSPADTPAPTCGGGPCPTAPPQEFLVVTPEASTVAIMLVQLFVLLGSAALLCKRKLRYAGEPR